MAAFSANLRFQKREMIMNSTRISCMRKGFYGLRRFALSLCLVGGILFGGFFQSIADEPEPDEKTAKEFRLPNRLANEKSPYLLQHARNPVDWFPWGQEAFDKAKAEDKIIFLSVGYSTCHWCHVMEHESFENKDIAEIMNQHFVCVKVDREERPDVDRVYMSFVQAATGSGGWPMSVWLTPDLKPIVGGTYFPPEDKFGRPGFPTVLRQIAAAWKTNREALANQGNHFLQALRQHFAPDNTNPQTLNLQTLDAAYQALAESFDEQHGGFGDAPKFPRPSILNFLQRYAAQNKIPLKNRQKARFMALFTLDQMAAGGMHDHLGGGFHRYSVDKFWHVPHFEKMLYDQAQLAVAYLEAFQVTGQEDYEAVARDILQYVLRDMTDEAGGFYSAEDADSSFLYSADKNIVDTKTTHPKHGEGAFYIWTKQEIDTILGKEAATQFNRFYDVKTAGNAPPGSDPHGEFKGRNILIQSLSLEEAAATFNITPDTLAQELEASRKKLFQHREKRPRPHLDDKIITAWNGLMISAFAKAHQVLENTDYLNAAVAAASFLKDNLYLSNSRKLLRHYRQGASNIEGFAEDYAFLIQGLLDLYETSFDIQWLQWAETLQETQNRLFWDKQSAGFYSAAGKDPSILLRLKEDYDGAEPSPNSVSAMNLLRLAQITANNNYFQQAQNALNHFSETLVNQPTTSPQMLAALQFSLAKPKQIVFAAQPGGADFKILLRILHKPFLPNKIILLADNGADQAYLAKRLPFLRNLQPIENRATAFVCEDFVCQLPTADPAQFQKQIQPSH